MTPKDKAKELVNKDWNSENWNLYESKRCALICVDEILNSHIDSVYESYYLKVKQEINKL